MTEYGFPLTRIFLYNDRIFDFVLIRENTDQTKPDFDIRVSLLWRHTVGKNQRTVSVGLPRIKFLRRSNLVHYPHQPQINLMKEHKFMYL